MDNREIGLLLEECRMAAGQTMAPTAEAKLNYRKYKGSLTVELSSLLQEAVDMNWPFVPERWQYKHSVSSQDQVNLKDLISEHLPQLLITKEVHRHHPGTPIAPQLVIRQARVYLNLGKLQKAEYILSSLINNCGATGRSFNKSNHNSNMMGHFTQSAKFIWYFLGCWVYHSDSDRALVQAVSIQVRGLVLQKLGLWQEAAELICGSLVGYYALPQPDKKGIGTSLGVLANLLVSMSDTDFKALKSNPNIDLFFFSDTGHRLLCAAEAAKHAVIYSQYTSLYVLTNVVTHGTCLLSYSFSVECSSSEKYSFLLQAKEAFEIGLITKTEKDLVISKQELYTLVKAAYCLLVTHKWLHSSVDVQAIKACREAIEKLYTYCHTEKQDKDTLSTEIMHLLTCVKSLLRVKSFPNSNEGSFIPDSYRSMHGRDLRFTLNVFSPVIRSFQQYHASVCEASETGCQGKLVEKAEGLRPGLCITTLGTTISTFNTEPDTKNFKPKIDKCKEEFNVQKTFNLSGPQTLFTRKQEFCQTVCSTDALLSSDKVASESIHKCNEGPIVRSSSLKSSLASSWQNIAKNSTRIPLRKSSNKESSVLNEVDVRKQCDPYYLTEVSKDGSNNVLEPTNKNRNHERESGFNAPKRPRSQSQVTSSAETGGFIKQFEMINEQSLIETVGIEEPWLAVGQSERQTGVDMVTQTQSHAKLKTSSSLLGDSFGSQSSWEKLSMFDPCSPVSTEQKMLARDASVTVNKHGLVLYQSLANAQLPDLSRLEIKSSKPLTTDQAQSFLHIETTDGAARQTCPGFLDASHPKNPHCFIVDQDAETEANTDPEPNKAYHKSAQQPAPEESKPEQCLSTETGSSFELIEKEMNNFKIDEPSCNVEQQNRFRNLSCYTCQNHGMMGNLVPERQYFLTQQDYEAFLACMCHSCLLNRLQSTRKFKLRKHQSAYNALQLKYSRVTGLWTAHETYAYIGESIGKNGQQRTALWVQSLHQEERLGRYVAKEYLKPKEIQFHLNDVERQMTAQYYVTQFNKTLYNHKVTAQIFFIPSEVLLILEEDEIIGCVTMEPYLQGDFVKLTNNTGKVVKRLEATEYGIAFGHFTYLYSNNQEIVVDLQGWVTANGKGLTYLTDPQIHSLKTPKGASNFGRRGLKYFLEEQHGPECNNICKLLKLSPMAPV
ncbi:alpha-protein kinase 1 isoform X3 [Hypomesus transpacificus]|uniref:alpha-protein kinase 1 isoform X3 n=1 Tax=Hypomesus transpacificus TaxID=137520 RepID=UPI001F079DEC|nr:alpha-protein kinase 1 isoform X3 [Hypomesus transpacificus]